MTNHQKAVVKIDSPSRGKGVIVVDNHEKAVECDCPLDQYGVRVHPSSCPAVSWIPKLEEMRRQRLRAAAEARNYVIY